MLLKNPNLNLHCMDIRGTQFMCCSDFPLHHLEFGKFRLGIDIHVQLRINSNLFCDPLTFTFNLNKVIKLLTR